MYLEIITPQQIHFSGEVNSVTLSGESGLFTVWENHAPLISSLVQGKIKYVDTKNEENEFEIESGFAEVKKNRVVVCVETKS
jgi:F-type H+-transporting ATPase subunit epsilon